MASGFGEVSDQTLHQSSYSSPVYVESPESSASSMCVMNVEEKCFISNHKFIYMYKHVPIS